MTPRDGDPVEIFVTHSLDEVRGAYRAARRRNRPARALSGLETVGKVLLWLAAMPLLLVLLVLFGMLCGLAL